MKGLEEFISRERGFGISDPKRIKTEKSEPDAGTKMETVASELSGNAVPSESQIHKVLSFISLPPSAASNGTLRRSLRKYGNLSSTQLVFLDVLDCVDEIQHKRELMLEYHEAASDPRFPPAIARLYQARASRLGIEWLFLQEDRLPQLKSDFNVALTVAAPQGAGEGKVIENSPPTKQKRKLSREEKDGRKKGGEQRSVIEDEDAKKILAENERRGKPRSIRGRANLLKKWCATKEILRKDENPITSRNIESLLLNKKRQRRLNMC